MAEKRSAIRKEKKPAVFKLKNLAILALLIYAVVVLVSQQVAIAEKKKENQKLKTQISYAQQSYDDNSRLLSMYKKDPKGAMEKIAIERLGLGYPNEKRLYDASKS